MKRGTNPGFVDGQRSDKSGSNAGSPGAIGTPGTGTAGTTGSTGTGAGTSGGTSGSGMGDTGSSGGGGGKRASQDYPSDVHANAQPSSTDTTRTLSGVGQLPTGNAADVR